MDATWSFVDGVIECRFGPTVINFVIIQYGGETRSADEVRKVANVLFRGTTLMNCGTPSSVGLSEFRCVDLPYTTRLTMRGDLVDIYGVVLHQDRRCSILQRPPPQCPCGGSGWCNACD